MGEIVNLNQITGDSPLIRRLHEARLEWAGKTEEERAAIREADEKHRRRTNHASLRNMACVWSQMEPELFARTLADYKPDPGQIDAFKCAKRFAECFPGTTEQPIKRALWIHGVPGVGKSDLMQRVAVEILTKPKIYKLLYIACAEIDRLREKIDVEFSIIESQIVIFDDIEKGLQEPGSKFTPPSDGIIRRAINRADRVGKPIVCATSNLRIEQIKQKWPALGSRLAGLMHPVEMTGADHREDPQLPYWAR